MAVVFGASLLVAGRSASTAPPAPHSVTSLPTIEAAVPVVRAIELRDRGGRLLTNFKPQATVAGSYHADLGDFPSDFQLHIHATSNADIKVEQRYKTSLAIADSGDHLDLLEWKHFVSKSWLLTSHRRGPVWRVPVASLQGHDTEAFPSFTRAELKQAALDFGDAKWAKVVDRDPDAAYVAPSHVELIVSVRTPQGWQKVHTVSLVYPLGC